MVLTLYKLDASPPVRAVYMTIEYLGISDVEFVDVNVLELDHLKQDYINGAIICGEITALTPKMLDNIVKGYEFTEKFLTTSWLAGKDITVADICCVATISTLKELVAIDEYLYPQLTGWLQRCSEEEFYKKGNEPGLLKYRELITSKLS